jgi:hypothetical protein
MTTNSGNDIDRRFLIKAIGAAAIGFAPSTAFPGSSNQDALARVRALARQLTTPPVLSPSSFGERG